MPKEPHPAWLDAVQVATPAIARLAVFGAANMTALEKRFWKKIGGEGNPWGLIPQFPLHGFVLDFYDPVNKVCVETDGPHHRNQKAADLKRDKILFKAGVLTIRFTAADLVRFGSRGLYTYLERYFNSLDKPAAPPPPPPPPAPKPLPPPPPKPGPNDTPFD